MGKRILVEETLAKDGVMFTIKKADLDLLENILKSSMGVLHSVDRVLFQKQDLKFAYAFRAAIKPYLKAKM